jgi:Uma2 family endonuclease
MAEAGAQRKGPTGKATFEDLARLPEEIAAEVIGGEIVPKAAPTFDHGETQGRLAGELGGRFGRPPGGGIPGGWWIGTEVDVEYEAHEVYRHDLAGWRCETGDRPSGRPVRRRPDWVCEVLAPSSWRVDTVSKFRTLHRRGVLFYWVADPEHGTLTVYRHEEDGYLVAAVAERGEVARLPPFDAVELEVGFLLGDDPAA